MTIKVLQLDEHHELRSEHLDNIRRTRELSIDLARSVDPKILGHAKHFRDFVEGAVRPERHYSAMVAAHLEANPLPEPAPEAINRAGGAAIES
jgi:hypothetical protein